MENDLNVNGFMTGLRPLEAGDGVSEQRGSLVMIGFFLKDALKVFAEEGGLAMAQCYYEQKIVSVYASEVDDLDYVKNLAYQTLHADMRMQPQAAKMVKGKVARTIRRLVQQTRATNTSPFTLLLEIHVECTIEEAANRRWNGTTGEHGYDRLVQRLKDEVCGVCLSEFTVPSDTVVTSCRHTYHSACLFHWLYQGSHTCPMCRSDVAPMVGGKISF